MSSSFLIFFLEEIYKCPILKIFKGVNALIRCSVKVKPPLSILIFICHPDSINNTIFEIGMAPRLRGIK